MSQYHYLNINISTLGGKLMLVLRNSWSRHLSVTYNEKYEYVLRVTWVGYQFFGTLALAIYLIQVSLLVRDKATVVWLSGRDWRGVLPGSGRSPAGGCPPVPPPGSHYGPLARPLQMPRPGSVQGR